MVRMLPKSRVLSILALGLGCILLGVGFVLPRLVDADRPVPLDLGDTQLTVSDPEATIGKAYLATAGEKDPDVINGPVSRNVAATLADPSDRAQAAATGRSPTTRASTRGSIGDQAGLLDAENGTQRVNL